MRNVDSKIHAARFDRFKFLFHSFAVATFATISTHSGHLHCINPLMGTKRPTGNVRAMAAFGGKERPGRISGRRAAYRN
jgi:hypothetical protein